MNANGDILDKFIIEPEFPLWLNDTLTQEGLSEEHVAILASTVRERVSELYERSKISAALMASVVKILNQVDPPATEKRDWKVDTTSDFIDLGEKPIQGDYFQITAIGEVVRRASESGRVLIRTTCFGARIKPDVSDERTSEEIRALISAGAKRLRFVYVEGADTRAYDRIAKARQFRRAEEVARTFMTQYSAKLSDGELYFLYVSEDRGVAANFEHKLAIGGNSKENYYSGISVQYTDLETLDRTILADAVQVCLALDSNAHKVGNVFR